LISGLPFCLPEKDITLCFNNDQATPLIILKDNMMKTANNSTFKKTLLSTLVISAVVGAFIPWEDYMPRAQSPEMKAFYQERESQLETIVMQSVANVDSDTLAQFAEDNLLIEINAEIDEQVASKAEAFIEQMASPEADEVDAQVTESEALIDSEEVALIPEVINDNEALYMLESPLLFAFDSSEINPHYYEALNDSALFMVDESKKQDTIWQVVGYADPSGNAHYNNRLAKKRAQKVAAYLVAKGVDEAQLTVVSLGASHPVNNERSIENNRHERRVEIHRYQAEVTALVAQYNRELAQQASDAIAKSDLQATTKPVLKPLPVVPKIQSVALEQTTKREVIESDHGTKSELINSAQQPPSNGLATVMEL